MCPLVTEMRLELARVAVPVPPLSPHDALVGERLLMAAAIVVPAHLASDLKALHLSTVAAQWRSHAERPVRQRQTPADYLAQLVDLEVTARPGRRIHDARFPMLRTLDALSFHAPPDLDSDAVPQVFDRRFVAEPANAAFASRIETGKTHPSIALRMACCQHGYRARLVTAADLVTMLLEAQQQAPPARKLIQLARFDVVRVAELRYLPRAKTPADLLFPVRQPTPPTPELEGDPESEVRAPVRDQATRL